MKGPIGISSNPSSSYKQSAASKNSRFDYNKYLREGQILTETQKKSLKSKSGLMHKNTTGIPSQAQILTHQGKSGNIGGGSDLDYIGQQQWQGQ